MDALTLGIGLQGQHNFSLDGAKALLDAQKAKAAQAIAAQKKADEEMSAAIKDATALVDPSKLANVYHKPVTTAFNGLVQELSDMRKDGTGDFGLKVAKKIGEFKNKVAPYYVSSGQYMKDRGNLHPEVVDMMDDFNGIDRVANRGLLLGQEVNTTESGDVILNPVPYSDPFQGLIANLQKEKPELMPVEGQEPVVEMIPGTNRVIRRVGTAITQADREALVNRYTALMLDPQTAPNAMISLYGEVNPDMIEDFQGGGVMPKAEVKNAIRARVNQIIDEHPAFRGERKEEGTKPAPKEPSQSSFANRIIINPARYTGEDKNEIRVHLGKASGGELPKANVPVDRKTMSLMTQNGKIEPMKASGSIEAVPEGLFYDKAAGKMRLAYVTKVDSDGTSLKGFDESKYLLVDFNESNFAAFAGHMGAKQEELMSALLDRMSEAEESTAHQEFLDGLQKLNVSSPSAGSGKSLPLIKSKAEFDALPKGAEYTKEDGKTYRKG